MSHAGFYSDPVLSNSQLDVDFDSGTTGSIVKRHLQVTVDPSDVSDRVVISRRDESVFVSENNLISGGDLRSHDDKLTLSSFGSLINATAHSSRFSLGGSTVVTTLNGYTVALEDIGVTNTVDTLYGYKFENMTSVPNQSGIVKKVAFANLDPEASIENHGSYEDAFGNKMAPANSLGLVPGRLYGPLYSSSQHLALLQDNLYFARVYVPYNTTIDTLQVRVTVAGASGAQIRLGIYRLLDGKLSGSIADGITSADTVGVKTVTLNTAVSSGNYMLCVSCSAGLSIMGGTPTADSSVELGTSSIPTDQFYAAPVSTFLAVPSVFNDPLPGIDDYPGIGNGFPLPLIYYTVGV